MGTKHDPLTEAEVEVYSLRRRVLAMLDECARHFGISCLDLRVLDWGCGCGTTVAKLVEMGFDAYGVDIDPEPIKNGYPLFLAHGLEPERRLVHIEAGCRTQFAPPTFFARSS
jgi:2-polyprenyl-3-methyl-5-hydroxy-6-metoxy-1,4-benzoquinol methylase